MDRAAMTLSVLPIESNAVENDRLVAYVRHGGRKDQLHGRKLTNQG